MEHSELFRREKISKVLLRLAPPVMLAQLIQALYNIYRAGRRGLYLHQHFAAR